MTESGGEGAVADETSVTGSHDTNAMTEGTDGPVRGHHGQYDKDPRAAELSAKALDLRRKSVAYRDIAAALGISTSTAYRAVQRGLKETMQEPADEVRQLELEKLDALERAALGVLEREHVVVSQGKVFTDQIDDGIVLQAVSALVRVGESRRKLLGLDSPAKVTLDGGVRYEVVGVDAGKLT